MKRSFDIFLRKRPQVFNLFSSFPVAMYISKMWHKIFIYVNRCVATIVAIIRANTEIIINQKLTHYNLSMMVNNILNQIVLLPSVTKTYGEKAVSGMMSSIRMEQHKSGSMVIRYVSELYHDIHIVTMDMLAYMGTPMLVKDYDAQNKMVYEYDEMSMKMIEMDMTEV